MEIPVCHITEYNTIKGTIVYNLESDSFSDKLGYIADRTLPRQDYFTCAVDETDICTVVGKVKNNFVVCFGDNFLYYIPEDIILSRYRVSNLLLVDDKRQQCIDGSLKDLSYLFEENKIRFISMLKEQQASSLGLARKFFAEYDGKVCIVKFSKHSNKECADLKNEVTYKQIADILGIPCCSVKLSSYYNRPCILSFFEYDNSRDVFMSFKSTGLKPSEIYLRLSDEEKWKYDRMMLLDYILEQGDRHFSNIALVNQDMYPLFDNGSYSCL